MKKLHVPGFSIGVGNTRLGRKVVHLVVQRKTGPLHHNFSLTPPEKIIINKLTQAQTLGADIAKIALMPKSQAEVPALLSATYKARTGPVSIPQFTISMGKAGAISRICGGQFGSDITFSAHEVVSAPGQITVKELRQVMQAVYWYLILDRWKFPRLKNIFNSKREKRPKRIKGLDGVYSLKRLATV